MGVLIEDDDVLSKTHKLNASLRMWKRPPSKVRLERPYNEWSIKTMQ